MRERERERPERQPTRHASPGVPAADDDIDRLQADVDGLLAAADEAITRGLSEDSQRFLRANRQSSGQ